MRTTKEEAIPTYGLDDYELIESSTAAMLAELDSAISDEEPIVVTLWRPHIAYAQYDLKDLEDPEGAMGGAEEIHAVGRKGFSEDFPELAEWLRNFELSDEELSSLEQAVLADHEDDPEAGAREWLTATPSSSSAPWVTRRRTSPSDPARRHRRWGCPSTGMTPPGRLGRRLGARGDRPVPGRDARGVHERFHFGR